MVTRTKRDKSKKKEKYSHKILSLFANIGVAEAYLESIGFHVAVANELDEKRVEIYRSVYPNTNMISGDITHIETYRKIIAVAKSENIDIVMATPPCQGMSSAGKQQKFDERNNLFLYAVNAIRDLAPKYFMFENVTAFMTTEVKIDSVVKLIPRAIEDILGDDYEISFNSINTCDYGVPQNRERVIVLGTRKGIKKKWLMPVSDGHIVTMEEAIGRLPSLDPHIKDVSEEKQLEIFPEYYKRRDAALMISPWHFPPSHIHRQVVAMQHTPTGKSAFENENEAYKPRKKDGSLVRGFRNTYKRQRWDLPAYTILMHNIEISSQDNVHPGRLVGKDENGEDVFSDARALTIYELMKLMTLPDDWPIPFTVNKPLLRRIIGEGIPSLLVKKIYLEIAGK